VRSEKFFCRQKKFKSNRKMIDSNFDLPGWATAVDPRTGRQ
jgi:hypothetical protein